MTPAQLDHLLARAGQPPLPPEGDLDDALDRVEAAAEAHSTPEVERAFGALLRRQEAVQGLPPVIAGVRREDLVRWDAFTVTFTGHDVSDGRPALVRTLHPPRGPRRQRWLARQAGRLPGAQVHEGALRAELPGEPLAATSPGDPTLARLLLTGLMALQGRSVPPLAAPELRRVDGRVQVACLSLGPDASGGIRALASTLAPRGEGPLADVVRGLAQMPPARVDEARVAVVRGLARELAGTRHHLQARWSASLQHTRVERLGAMVQRLIDALPPPRGRAAAGVDMNGDVFAVASDESTVTFGPPHDPAPVWSADEGFDAALARRLLRMQAAAPPNPRLSRDLGGDAAFGDVIGRWVAAGLRLRTLTLLLKAQGAG
jgi:hypothetical protein